MPTDKRATEGDGDDRRPPEAGPEAGTGPAAPRSPRDPYEDEHDQAIDPDPQLRAIGRARLRKRTGRPEGGDEPGRPHR